jgi:WhiB family redox-sensing transcriptional regulator
MKLLETQDENGNLLARCCESSVNPDWFFEPVYEQDAIKICAECPLVKECLTLALTEEIPFGVWGGLTEQNRKDLLRQSNRMNRRKAR